VYRVSNADYYCGKNLVDQEPRGEVGRAEGVTLKIEYEYLVFKI